MGKKKVKERAGETSEERAERKIRENKRRRISSLLLMALVVILIVTVLSSVTGLVSQQWVKVLWGATGLIAAATAVVMFKK